MIPARLFACLSLLLLPACAPVEPINGCTMAAANQREVLRARAYLHPAIPARLLGIYFTGRQMGHAVLIYRLDPEGWFVYEDTFGSRPLNVPDKATFPDPLTAARAALPARPIASARWFDCPERLTGKAGQ